MARFILGKAAVKRIHAAIDDLFTKAKSRFLGRDYGPKRISFSITTAKPELSLPGLFEASSRAEGMRPNEQLKESLQRVAEAYLDAHKEKAKADVVHTVQAFLHDAEQKGVNTDVKTVLGGELSRLFGEVGRNVRRIVDTESTRARNTGAVDAISKLGIVAGEEDPVVYFAVVRDQHLCDECVRLHLMEDGVTPRLWRLSEVTHAHHKRGEDHPSVGGLHPHCRCTMVQLRRGWKFDASGRAVGAEPGHNELAVQRGF